MKNENDDLKKLINKRKKIWKILFIIGIVVTGLFLLISLLVKGIDFEILECFVFCVFGLILINRSTNRSIKSINNISNENNNLINKIYNKEEKDDIDTICNELRIINEKRLISNTKNIVIIFAIFILMSVIFVFIFKRFNIVFSENTIIYMIVFISLLIPLLMAIYYRLTIKERGKSIFKFVINGNHTDISIDDKMKNILNNLYYKEKMYKREKVYYAYKSKLFFANISSLNRYLTYEIKDNYIEIKCWTKIFGLELPIMVKDSYLGIYNRMALINDIKFIRDNINL